MQVLTDRLPDMLSRLKLAGIRDQIDSLLDEAARADLDMRQTLALLCEREIARKDARRIDMALKLAHFPVVRDLKGFDFTAQPSIDAKQICDLAAARWIANGDNLLLLGPPGVGKTHLAIALGRAAILAGYATLFVPATALLAQLAKGHADGRLEERLMLLAKPKLLIVDELGYLPFEPDGAHLFFQLVSRRYERGAMLITSNRSVGEWDMVFGAPVVVSSSDEFSLLVGIENSLVDALAWTAGTGPGRPSAHAISHHSLEIDSEGSGGGGPARRTFDDLGSSPTGTFDHGDRPAHRTRSEDDPQIHRTRPRAAGLRAAPGRQAEQACSLSRLPA